MSGAWLITLSEAEKTSVINILPIGGAIKKSLIQFDLTVIIHLHEKKLAES